MVLDRMIVGNQKSQQMMMAAVPLGCGWTSLRESPGRSTAGVSQYFEDFGSHAGYPTFIMLRPLGYVLGDDIHVG